MEARKNDENIILKLKKHLGKMMVQVDFLYRNGRSLEQFDYDILMDRTREFYELLIDSQEFNQNLGQSQDLDDDQDVNDEPADNDVEFEIEMPGDNEDPVEEKVSDEEENPVEENTDDNDDFDDEENHVEENADDDDDFDDEDWEDEEDVTFSIEPLDFNDDEKEKAVDEEDEEKAEETDSVDPENPVVSSIPEDNSLAARLQRRPISDIKSAVTLNDRIMMIHDLFRGSEERYNKTIDVLNEFPTVGGAIVYLSELRVELQWDVESEAYTKLQELVERRFL